MFSSEWGIGVKSATIEMIAHCDRNSISRLIAHPHYALYLINFILM
jgi:hypothetical protein